MKKIFSQIWQLVSKHRKKLVYWVLAFFIGQICFLGIWWIWNRVFAEDEKTLDEKMVEKVNTWKASLEIVIEIANILIYPVLILVWKLVDNSLVYWKFFSFDAVLWQLWIIVRNLANYTLGFIFIYKIFRYLINNSKEKVKDIIIRALIAWIWIQASWFFMGALIDLSTILTYSVWWLPISILGEVTESEEEKEAKEELNLNPYILKTVVTFDVEDQIQYIYLSNTTGDFYISECETFTYNEPSWQKEELIFVPKMRYYKTNSGEYIPTYADKCHYHGQVYYFGEAYKGIGDSVEGIFFRWAYGKYEPCSEDPESDNYCKNRQSIHEGQMITHESKLKDADKKVIEDLITKGVLLEIWDAHDMENNIDWSLFNVKYSLEHHRWLDKYNERTWTWWATKRLSDLLADKSYAWVFSALYSSMLVSWKATINQFTNAKWKFTDVINTAYSVLYILAISIPLLVVALVFIMRIWIIWIAIAFSPFIVLFTAFDLFKSDSIKNIKLLEYLSLENLIPIIFSPAIICFAVSISTVLYIIITHMNVELSDISRDINSWLVRVEIAGSGVKISKFVMLVLWVAVTWFIVWAAVEASKLWKSKIVQGIKNLTTSALGSLPVVPVLWKDWKTELMWVNTVFGLNGQPGIFSRMSDEIKSKYDKENREAMDALFDPGKAAKNAQASRRGAYTEGLKSRPIGENWMEEQVMIWENKDTAKSFGSFDEVDQKSIIDEINTWGKDKLQNIPVNHTILLNSGKKYKFVRTRQKEDDNWKPIVEDVYKYELQETS